MSDNDKKMQALALQLQEAKQLEVQRRNELLNVSGTKLQQLNVIELCALN